MKFLILLAVVMATTGLPQNWPYRDNHEYYGYQNRGNYRAGFGSGEDDEVENSRVRQDLKVGGGVAPGTVGQSPVANAASPVVVVETGSAKPVAQSAPIDTNNKQANAPKPLNAGDPSKQPAFPPATPPSQPPPPADDSSEEESDEDAADTDDNPDTPPEEQDDDDEDDDEEDNDTNNRRRNDPVVMETNSTAVANTTTPTVARKPKPNKNVQTVEALVPGYVTEEGEVLVPFDTVVKDGDGGVVAVVEDPSYTKNAPPVVVLPSAPSEERPVPKFFNPSQEEQLYYSQVPPPGAIFTFDDDNEVDPGFMARQGETSSEEAQDDDDTSSAQDDGSEEETSESNRPPLSWVKATAPSGEDDEAESLGIRLARSHHPYYYPSRSPNYYHHGNGYYVTRYPAPNPVRRGGYYYQPSYDGANFGYKQQGEYSGGQYSMQEPIYYYRPASNEKVRVVPIGSFDVSLEEGGGVTKAVVSPFYNRPRRPPTQTQVRRPTPPYAHMTSNNYIRRHGNNKPSSLYVYNIEGGTPISRQRNNKQRREAKELKKKQSGKKIKDPLGLLSKKEKKVKG